MQLSDFLPTPPQQGNEWKDRGNGVRSRPIRDHHNSSTQSFWNRKGVSHFIERAIVLNSSSFAFRGTIVVSIRLSHVQTYSSALARLQSIEQRIATLTSFMDYNAQPIVPRPISDGGDQPTPVGDILSAALSLSAESTESVIASENPTADAYNESVAHTVSELREMETEVAAILMQACIRRKRYRSVFFTHINNRISRLPRRPRCCFLCYVRKQEFVPEVDYSPYFDENTWLASPQELQSFSRDDLVLFVEALQLQLLSVEDRIPCNNKVAILLGSDE